MGSVYCQNSQQLLDLEPLLNNGNHKTVLSQLKGIKINSLPAKDKAFYNYLVAKALEKNNEEDKAYQYYLISKKQYLSLDSIDRAMDITLHIAYLVSAQDNAGADSHKYIDEYMQYAIKTNNKVKLAQGYLYQALEKMDGGNYKTSLTLLNKAKSLNKEGKDAKLQSALNNNIAALYNEYLNKPDSALYYFRKDLQYIKEHGTIEHLCYNYINQAASYYYMGNHKKAIEYLNMADALPLKDYSVKTRQYIYEYLYKNYDALGDYNNAYKYLELNKKFADSINVVEQNVAINDIQTKYRTKEKELENSLLKSKINTNRIILYTILGLLLASIIIGLLIIKNSRRKEKIAHQEKLIEQQKFEKALKDYELSSIDMMLEGQEKERQRIANDLHDNLGSMLATLKLNFENLKLRKNELRDEESKLYERTDALIEEAYQKVRRLAHAKNAGVLANEGLIPALQKLAEKISIPGKLQIHVVPFGFDERIENTLEIAIFRMVQELATNIIKHSEATESTIHLTHHDHNINIIVEDNGKGLDTKTLATADGMGIASIRRKTEQLNGTMSIDSTPGRGTTIIIDIPV